MKVCKQGLIGLLVSIKHGFKKNISQEAAGHLSCMLYVS